MEHREYLSDVIGNEYKEWHNEKIVLDCGTGRGKTHFILNKLSVFALENGKNVLYLSNRNKLKEQIEREVNKSNLYNVTVMNYQKLQQDINNKTRQNIYYDYIIADEVHYIFTDSTFNFYTDIIYEYLLEQRDNVVVYMSATAKSLFGMLCKQEYVNKNRVYKLDADYSYVDKVYFYDRKLLKKLVNAILRRSDDEKVLVFINSEDTMLELYELYKDIANYYSSKSTKKLKNIREENCIVSMGGKISFEKRILFTTTALDNGVDIKDEKIKYIISEIFEPDTAMQCLGRKRPLNKNDICTFFIADYEKAYISYMKNINESILKPLILFRKDNDEFKKRYGLNRTFHNDYLYPDWDNNNILKLNLFGYYNLQIKKLDMTGMINHGYAESMCTFNMSKELKRKVIILKTPKEVNMELNQYLNSIIGKQLFKAEKEDLKEKVKNAGLDGKSYSNINKLFQENGYKYKITTKRERTADGQLTAWIVKKYNVHF